MKIEHIKTFNWCGAIRGMRNPLESWNKSDSKFGYNEDGETVKLCKNDIDLAIKLSKAGSDHRKFMRQIFISFDLTAPEYFWREEATYKVGTVENSTSQMHKLGSRYLTYDDFQFDAKDETTDIVLKNINTLIYDWKYSNKLESGESEQIWRKILQIMPQSFLYTRTVTMNYEVLMNMYHSRKSHKLKEWRWVIEELMTYAPYTDELIKQNGI